MTTKDLCVVSSSPAFNADVIDYVIDGPHGQRSISVSGLEFMLSGQATSQGVAYAKYIAETSQVHGGSGSQSKVCQEG
jgi:hypothetical protein